MKILQVTNKVPYPIKDGGAIACMNLTRGFSLNGHKVTVLAMNTQKHHILYGELPESVKDLAEFKLVEVPARISRIAALGNLLFSRKPYNAVRFISGSFEKELIKLLKGKQFDVIQLEGLYVCPYIPVIRKYSNAKIVYRAHNIEHEIWERTAAMAKGWEKIYFRILSRRIKKLEKGMMNRYDLLVPITEREKCWPKINDKFPELKFYIAGRNAPYWFKRKMDLPNVVFEGEVPDAYDFMNSKSIMVVPLFSGSGMRIKIIEGMALGKPIITTSIGTEGISTTAGENIMLAETADEFVSSISELIDNREFFDKIGRNAIEYIHEKFDNLAAAAALIEFYKQHTQ